MLKLIVHPTTSDRCSEDDVRQRAAGLNPAAHRGRFGTGVGLERGVTTVFRALGCFHVQ